jgi:hypothetical protein
MHDTTPEAFTAVDPYAAPAAALVEPGLAERPHFYVVSAAKFWTLSLVTGGMYGIYWMYRQWTQVRLTGKGSEWPVMRSIFQVFYVHALVREIDQRLRRTGVRLDWNPEPLASSAVVAMLVGGVLSRMSASGFGVPVTNVLSLVLVVVIVLLKSRIQRAANAACGDPDGSGNARFTGANIVWIVLGACFWLLALVGTLAAPAAT